MPRNTSHRFAALCIAVALLLTLGTANARPQEHQQPSLQGQVVDVQGGAIIGARVTIIGVSGTERVRATDSSGRFIFADIPTGTYKVRVAATNFKAYEATDVNVGIGSAATLTISLNIETREETITVLSENPLVKDAEYSGGTFILRGDALRALEGTGGIEAMLRALAVRSAGPFGPQALVNGFEDGQIPPIYSIREIRINDNPFSAEYSTLGLGRIEILTKPGSEKLHVEAFGDLGDAKFNSRNPYASNRVRYQSRMFGGFVSGPILPTRSTFFVDFNRQEVDTNAVIHATVLDAAPNIVPLQLAVVTPERRTSVSPRIDFQINTSNTLVARYSDLRTRSLNSGVGEFSLASRAQTADALSQTLQLTETAVVNQSTINETRWQYIHTRSSRFGNNSTPVISVPGAFVGGGADIGSSYDRQQRMELHNITSWQMGEHLMKAGIQANYNMQTDGSSDNFGGMYTFASRIGPELNSRNEVVKGADGQPILIPLTTMEAYRRTVLFRRLGLSAPELRQLGGGASQFSITTGDVETQLHRYQFGVFVQDDWRIYPKFTVSGGLRYERQGNVSGTMNFAPRLAFAWGLGGGTGQPKTVLRAGAGVFYDRVGDRLILRSRQMDGIHQRQFIVSDPSILDFFPSIPPSNLLSGLVPQTRVQLAPDLETPYTLHSSVSIERQILPSLSVAVTASQVRGFHLLRSRNINAPLPGTYNSDSPSRGVRPLGVAADIYQYESSGVFKQRQFMLNLVYRAGKRMTLWSTYTLGDAKTDTDQPDTFPSNSFDLRPEFGRTATDARQTWYWGGWMRTFKGIELSPLVVWRTEVPFDIITGRDNNGDSLFTDRPAFATDPTRPSVVATRFGAFDLNPMPGQQIIPRNFGVSPRFFIANLRISRRFPFNEKTAITFALQGQNIFNRTNPGLPVGNLGSPFFGISNSSASDWGFGSNQAGNRRLEALVFFSF